MQKLSIILLVCGIFFAAPLLARDTLVLNTPAGEPLTNPQLTGFIDQLVSEVLLSIGYALEVDHLPAERSLLLADNGIVDGELIRIGGLQEHYANLIQVPEKHFDMEFIAFAKDRQAVVSNWDDLKNYSVAIITGWKILESRIPANVDLIKVKNARQLFDLVSNGRVDLVLFSRWQGLAYTRINNYSDLYPVGSALVSMPMYTYFHKKNKNLIPGFTGALRDLKVNGRYQQLFDKRVSPLAR